MTIHNEVSYILSAGHRYTIEPQRSGHWKVQAGSVSSLVECRNLIPYLDAYALGSKHGAAFNSYYSDGTPFFELEPKTGNILFNLQGEFLTEFLLYPMVGSLKEVIEVLKGENTDDPV